MEISIGPCASVANGHGIHQRLGTPHTIRGVFSVDALEAECRRLVGVSGAVRVDVRVAGRNYYECYIWNRSTGWDRVPDVDPRSNREILLSIEKLLLGEK